ncbi:Fe2+-dependent dioxygenase [soil metagenome]
MLHIPAVLDGDAIARVQALLDAAPWQDGRATAGHMSIHVKQNRQLPEDCAAAREAGAIIRAALDTNALFMSGALPARIVPPLFNRYEGGETYGAHIDGAIRHAAGQRIRTDLSATLFLSAPESYGGGDLVVRDGGGDHRVKLACGDMILYAATSIHQVEPVTRGARTAAFFWIQSIVRDGLQRQMLFDLDRTIQALQASAPGNPALLDLTGHYHNLIRLWADG